MACRGPCRFKVRQPNLRYGTSNACPAPVRRDIRCNVRPRLAAALETAPECAVIAQSASQLAQAGCIFNFSYLGPKGTADVRLDENSTTVSGGAQPLAPHTGKSQEQGPEATPDSQAFPKPQAGFVRRSKSPLGKCHRIVMEARSRVMDAKSMAAAETCKSVS